MSETGRAVPFLDSPIDTTVRPPGSKSETIRALAAAALADGRSHLYSPLRAEDTEAMAMALRVLGVETVSEGDPWAVDGGGGRLQAGGTIDAVESGLSARILIAMAGSAPGTTRIEGRGRLPARPMAGIVDVLRSQGVEVDRDHLPIEITGRGNLWGGYVTVDCSASSQFATAAMLVAPVMEKPVVIELSGLSGSAGYLEGTLSVMRRFGADIEPTMTGFEIANTGYTTADMVIEPDASAAAYPMAIAAITGGTVVIDGLGRDSWQPDLGVARVLEQMGCRLDQSATRTVLDGSGTDLQGVDVDMSDAPDGALAVAVVALFASSPSTLGGLSSLRHKESDRLEAITSEMRRLGGRVEVAGESLRVEPSQLRGGVIDPHGDHRIAMAMACAGTAVEGVSVASPHVVDKTWPDFWKFLDLLSS
jgi:3-phosphoshikimate 1-carboxyvinyltransferase